MKKIAVMQPYLFPYIGYWQLIASVDCFVFYDDANYINKGWINRNRILLHGEPYKFILPLSHASQNKKINEIFVCPNFLTRKKLLKTITIAYKNTENYKRIFHIIEKTIMSDGKISDIIYNSTQELCEYLGIKTKFYLSSNLQYKKSDSDSAQEKIIKIVHTLGGDVYINPIGGQHLYSKKFFLENNISLFFINSNINQYKQKADVFYSNLSIIDILMFNSEENIHKMLNQYELQ
ncbi:WbqC family protein [uncultured Desulfovibrio sp.]|uniref:WbqC family protein n=1 Tax=uncultured Desulfovibrio sp. TaxID=167968 RepID=UPI0025E89124|nr:WbqC family protein [uncultured Desulfovibrio sp.]